MLHINSYRFDILVAQLLAVEKNKLMAFDIFTIRFSNTINNLYLYSLNT